MNAEVVNRTLDFQRIVTLSPRAILMGKMIGEPALSYFLMIASMPLAAICWGFGAASGSVIFWLYVNLTTFTLMWAAFGLINSLDAADPDRRPAEIRRRRRRRSPSSSPSFRSC